SGEVLLHGGPGVWLLLCSERLGHVGVVSEDVLLDAGWDWYRRRQRELVQQVGVGLVRERIACGLYGTARVEIAIQQRVKRVARAAGDHVRRSGGGRGWRVGGRRKGLF